MTKTPTIETTLLRKINHEIMMNNFDQECYQEALITGMSNKNSTLKNYTQLRLHQLRKSTAQGLAEKRESSFLSTTQLPTRISQKSSEKDQKRSRRKRQKLRLLETFIGSVILLLGSTSSLFCLWSHTGKDLSGFPYLPALMAIIAIQLVPWALKKSTLCNHLTAITSLCILIGGISCASGFLLLKNPPKKTAHEKHQATQSLPTLTIVPTKGKQSPKEETLALYNK